MTLGFTLSGHYSTIIQPIFNQFLTTRFNCIMCGLDTVDTREKLEIYAKAGLLSLGAGAALAKLGHEGTAN